MPRPRREHATPAPPRKTKPPLPDTADGQSVNWYFNWLVDRINEHGFPELTDRDAACVWAGVSQVDFDLQTALNFKAGFRPPGPQYRVNEVLNCLAYKTHNRDEITAWLTNRDALYKICKDIEAGG